MVCYMNQVNNQRWNQEYFTVLLSNSSPCTDGDNSNTLEWEHLERTQFQMQSVEFFDLAYQRKYIDLFL